MPEPNRSPTTFMPSISGPSITSSGRAAVCRASSVSASMKSTMPCTSACASRSATGASRQARSTVAVGALAADRLGELHQPVGGVGPPVEQHVLDEFQQVGRNVLVDRQLAGVDDAHVQPGADRVVQERRVHGLAHHVVAAERERQVGDAAAGPHARAALLDQRQRLDERLGVTVVLGDAGGDREHVRVEDDVLGREPDLLREQVVGPAADLHLALGGVGLPLSSNAMTTTPAP